MLKSRKLTKDDFVAEFEKTLMPGIIDRKDFINWERIHERVKYYHLELNFFTELVNVKSNKLEYLRDSLLSSDNPQKLLILCFELLAHTQPNFVSKQDKLNINELAKQIKSGNQKEANNFIKLLSDLKFEDILTVENINDYFFGILVGLETHKRKNLGGDSYIDEIRPILEKLVINLKKEGLDIELVEEETINYGETSSQSKKVDFAIKKDGAVKIGIEVNFYTNTGSKPTEIKRSYGQVNQKLNQKGIELVWVTDGFGYTIMHKSLGDAFEIHNNIYNTKMLKDNFEEDVIAFLRLKKN